MNQSESIASLAAALAAVQSALRPAEKNAKNPFFKSRYADLNSVWDACRVPMATNGLSVAQFPDEAEPGQVALTSILLHESGEWISARFTMTPAKDDPQGVGSALTYMRRYALAAMLGIVADEDDDGNAATQPRQSQPRQQPRQERPKATAPKRQLRTKEKQNTIADDAKMYLP